MYQEPPESLEQQSDQAILPNLNAQWVNAKGECFPPDLARHRGASMLLGYNGT